MAIQLYSHLDVFFFCFAYSDISDIYDDVYDHVIIAEPEA